jgi:hypothetical protein
LCRYFLLGWKEIRSEEQGEKEKGREPIAAEGPWNSTEFPIGPIELQCKEELELVGAGEAFLGFRWGRHRAYAKKCNNKVVAF